MPPALSEENKRYNTIRFINAARELIDSDGLEHISIRKIAEKAGFHNSTIYLYFKDVNQLILLASLKHFKEYNQALAALDKKHSSPVETFFEVWQFFCETVFGKPQIFYNFFFGKYSGNLTEIIMTYYSLFPDEKEDFSEGIERMYYAKNIHERCCIFLEPLTGERNVTVTAENLSLVNDIIVSCLKALLEERCQDPDGKPEDFTERMLEILHFIIEA